ncbi:hypothetical protein IC582_028621 [Cucumis melo]
MEGRMFWLVSLLFSLFLVFFLCGEEKTTLFSLFLSLKNHLHDPFSSPIHPFSSPIYLSLDIHNRSPHPSNVKRRPYLHQCSFPHQPTVPLRAKKCAYFPFEELCDKPLGVADYFGLFSK